MRIVMHHAQAPLKNCRPHLEDHPTEQKWLAILVRNVRRSPFSGVILYPYLYPYLISNIYYIYIHIYVYIYI